MTFKFVQLQVNAVIVHQIPKKEQAPPVYSEIESPLNDELKLYLRGKIIGSAGSASSFPIEVDEASKSPAPKLIAEYLKTGKDFVEMSRTLAKHLAKIQTRLNSAGLLTVVDCSFGTTGGLAILKLEWQKGIGVEPQVIKGKNTLSMEQINRLMLTDALKVFKVGVFQLVSSEIEAVASDHQRAEVDVAQFFLSDFLGCRLVEDPPVATKRFLDTTERFINEFVKDPKTKVEYQIALASELRSKKKQIRPRTFADEHLETKDRKPYCEFMEREGAMSAVDKDLALVQNRLAGLEMRFKSGAWVYAPPSAIEDGTVSVEQEENHARVVITDELSSMRGKGRGKPTEEPD